MKQMTCEMCGSKELLKQDGVFVCQTCGTKYSVEEARKMMIEGTVKIDHTADIENRLKNAIQEYKQGDKDRAYTLFSEILNLDSDNYLAIFYKALADAWNSSISNPRAILLFRQIKQVISLAQAKHPTAEEYSKIAVEFFDALAPFTTAYLKMYYNYAQSMLKKSRQESELVMKISKGSVSAYAIEQAEMHQKMAKKYSRDAEDFLNKECTPAVEVLNHIAVAILKPIDDPQKSTMQFYVTFEKYLNSYQEVVDAFGTYVKPDIISQYKQLLQIAKHGKNIVKQARMEKYWEEHKEEKSALDAKLASVESQLKDATQRLNTLEGENNITLAKLQNERNGAVPSDNDKRACEKRISEMESEYKSLGLFKGKEKKALMERINDEKSHLSEIESRIKKEKQELAARIDAHINDIKAKSKPIHQEIADLNKQKDEINYELTKDR